MRQSYFWLISHDYLGKLRIQSKPQETQSLNAPLANSEKVSFSLSLVCTHKVQWRCRVVGLMVTRIWDAKAPQRPYARAHIKPTNNVFSTPPN